MIELYRNKSLGQVLVFGIVVLLTCFVASPLATAAQRSKKVNPQQSMATTPEQIFSVGELYYNNGDIQDRASKQFRLVIQKYPASSEARKAQYYLGSYYQRKYYIQKERLLDDESRALAQAAYEYEKFLDKYSDWSAASSEYLSDARFNLSLVHLQLGDVGKAQGQFYRMREDYNRDRSVYIYQVVWSSNSKDVIDGSFDARLLSEYALSISSFGSFDQILSLLKRWCRSQKSR